MIDEVKQPKVDLVTRLQLEIANRLFGDEDTVGCIRKHAQCFSCIAALEERVGHRSSLADMHSLDTVEVLQIGADVGETVEKRLGRSNPGQCSQRPNKIGRWSR